MEMFLKKFLGEILGKGCFVSQFLLKREMRPLKDRNLNTNQNELLKQLACKQRKKFRYEKVVAHNTICPPLRERYLSVWCMLPPEN